jgi:hypothetical protein
MLLAKLEHSLEAMELNMSMLNLILTTTPIPLKVLVAIVYSIPHEMAVDYVLHDPIVVILD